MILLEHNVLSNDDFISLPLNKGITMKRQWVKIHNPSFTTNTNRLITKQHSINSSRNMQTNFKSYLVLNDILKLRVVWHQLLFIIELWKKEVLWVTYSQLITDSLLCKYKESLWYAIYNNQLVIKCKNKPSVIKTYKDRLIQDC